VRGRLHGAYRRQLSLDVADAKRQQDACVGVEPATPSAQNWAHDHEIPLIGIKLQRSVPCPVQTAFRRCRPPAVVMANEEKTLIDGCEAEGSHVHVIDRLVLQRPEMVDIMGVA
jgi:hypothetical protein